MSKYESIKGKILELEAGTFQNLCNAYLSRIEYPNIIALGSQAGMNKTTHGTLDTYFLDNNGKYILLSKLCSRMFFSTSYLTVLINA
jgi:hypothetical protein